VYEVKRFRILCVSTDAVSAQSQKGEFGHEPLFKILIAASESNYNHRVRVLTRSRSNAQLIFPVREFPGIVIAEEPKWKECIQGSNAVVNLAGMPISTRWSPEVSSSNLFDYLDCAFYATSKK
ncbi:hypothetical protein C3L33_19837, partial [Rhododendron williamsianum]